jgi:hypothetical protein
VTVRERERVVKRERVKVLERVVKREREREYGVKRDKEG